MPPELDAAVGVFASIEAETAEMDAVEARQLLEEFGVTEPGLDRVIAAGYGALDLIPFLTTGEDETRAWEVRRGATAPEAAGAIHTDLQRGFIRAEVISYEELVTAGSMDAAKAAGKLRVEGRTTSCRRATFCTFVSRSDAASADAPIAVARNDGPGSTPPSAMPPVPLMDANGRARDARRGLGRRARETQKQRNPILSFLGELPGLIVLAFALAADREPPAPGVLDPHRFDGAHARPRRPGDRRQGPTTSTTRSGGRDRLRGAGPGEGAGARRLGIDHALAGAGTRLRAPDNPDYIKRVVGEPGDIVSAHNGHVFVNGVKISEPYLEERTARFPKTKVPRASCS